MFKLTNSKISSWLTKGKIPLPKSIDVICPHCSKSVTYSTEGWHAAPERCFITSMRCPRCKESSLFVLIGQPTSYKLTNNESLWMLPAPSQKQALEGVDAIRELNEPLLRNYYSMVNVYNSGEWTATAVLSRRLLEGITLYILGEDSKKDTLAKRLSNLPSARDFSKPIISLSDAIRKGGNLGAHFDLEKEPDQKVATLMVDLIEDLIEYLFVLPARIDELHSRIETLGEDLENPENS